MKAIIGKRYRHYKGNEYTVLTIARSEAYPEEELVIYRAEYNAPDFGDKCVWAREKTLFEGMVGDGVKKTERFTLID